MAALGYFIQFIIYRDLTPMCLVRKVAVIIIFIMSTQIHASNNYYSFNASWDLSFPFEIKNLSSTSLNKNSYKGIKVKNGVLIDENGKKVRLWGAAIRFTKKLLFSPVKTRKQLILTMKNLGFNDIRFNGLDFNDPGIYREWEKTGKFNPKKMKSICEMIEYARSLGMSYTLSINHVTGKFKSSASLSKNKYSIENKQFKQIQLFDTKILAQTKKWFLDLLTIKHPSCSFSFSNDPNLYYINIVNEDSLFYGLSEQFRFLTHSNMNALENLFYSYIVSTYGGIDKVLSNWKSIGANDIDISSIKSRKQIPLCVKKNKWSNGWCNATIKFLLYLERKYFVTLKKAILSTGYKGIITTTNNWYGYFNLMINSEIGDALNMHVYFDHIMAKKIFGKRYETISNYSFIKNPFDYNGFRRNHILRLFSASVVEKPMIISEWNHVKFSDYTYEGPILLTAIALLQDIQSLNLHTFVSRDNFSEGYESVALSVLGNPILYALLPSLSYAFLNSNIENSSQIEFNEDISISNWKYIFDVGVNPVNINKYVPIQQGFKNKIRKSLFNGFSRGFKKRYLIAADHKIIKSVPDVLFWDRRTSGNEFILVRTPVFMALLGIPSTDIYVDARLKVKAYDHGAITFCPLDGKQLSESKKILITTVSMAKNMGQKFLNIKYGKQNLRVLLDKGKPPQLLKKNIFDLTVYKTSSANISVYPLLDGKSSITINPTTTSKNSIHFNLGNFPTPWYVIEIKD